MIFREEYMIFLSLSACRLAIPLLLFLHVLIFFIFFSIPSPVPDYVKATVETVLKIHETEDDGDVLAFLTGQVRSVSAVSTQMLEEIMMHWKALTETSQSTAVSLSSLVIKRSFIFEY